jgi:hypothetical protein
MGVYESTLFAVVDFDGGLMDGDEKEYLGCDHEGRIFSIDDDERQKGTETTERKRVIVRLFLVISHIISCLSTRFGRPVPSTKQQQRAWFLFSIDKPQCTDTPDERTQQQRLPNIPSSPPAAWVDINRLRGDSRSSMSTEGSMQLS